MTENKTHINQSDNYKKNFGIAYRSSTIFYFKKSKIFNPHKFHGLLDCKKIYESYGNCIIKRFTWKFSFKIKIEFDKSCHKLFTKY